jgi:polar amino acid transport system permease protein
MRTPYNAPLAPDIPTMIRLAKLDYQYTERVPFGKVERGSCARRDSNGDSHAIVARMRLPWRDWNERFGHLPWHRRYEVLGPALIAVLCSGLFLLPPAGKPADALSWIRIVLPYSLFFGWVLLIVSDKEKPVWFKRVCSISSVLVFFLLFHAYSGADWQRMREKFFDLRSLDGVFPMYVSGAWISIKLTLASAFLSLALGTFLGVLRTFKNPVLTAFTIVYVDLFRSFPLIALMVVVFYALPFVGVQLSPFVAAALSIVLMYSAYISEIVRSGVEAVHRSQIEAARSLGLSQTATLIHVVIPQAARIMIPPLTSSSVGILKDTVVAYTVTLPELLTEAEHAASWKGNPTPVVFSALIYLAILFPLTRLSSRLEKRSKKWIKKSR